MIPSPTNKGVVMIGGWRPGFGASSDLLELSQDSKGTFEWKILEQKLQHPRNKHISLPISNEIVATLKLQRRNKINKIFLE